METTRNYLKEYYENKEKNFSDLFSVENNEEEKIKQLKKELNDLQKLVDNKNLEIHNLLDKCYTKKYVPTSKKIGFCYSGKNGTYYYDLDTGFAIEDTENYVIYNLGNKNDIVKVVVGYCYEYASIIVKEYKYNIKQDNTKMSTKLTKEIVVEFLEGKVEIKNLATNTINECEYIDWEISKALDKVDTNEFIKNLYGVDYKGNLKICKLIDYNEDNKSFEIIIKTSPSEIIDNLLCMRLESSMPIHKILGITKETYEKSIERGVIKSVFENKELINGSMNEKIKINKTEKEWLDFIDEIKAQEEDLEFYNIDYRIYNYQTTKNSLLNLLLNRYSSNSVLYENYSLNKFANYVITETINQGYTKVRDFIEELIDYLEMCKCDNISPTLYSSYLKQTHDITSRNHKVVVEKEQEEIFKGQYKDFKEFKTKDSKYYVVCPKSSNDLKREGDNLNHCVASYIKRVINGECLIYFLRTDKEESLVTFEVRHNDIVQVRGKHNRKPTSEEINALKEFAVDRKLGTNY